MFVDDLLSAMARGTGDRNRWISSSIEAVYLLTGYPGKIQSPTIPATMSWDKMEDRPVGSDRVSLGYRFLGPILALGIEDEKVERLLAILLER